MRVVQILVKWFINFELLKIIYIFTKKTNKI